VDDLDNKTNPQLNEIFAVEVAALEVRKALSDGVDYWCRPRGGFAWLCGEEYADSADAVLPWLSKCDWVGINRNSNTKKWDVQLDLDSDNEIETAAKSATFARAATIALIRAERMKKAF